MLDASLCVYVNLAQFIVGSAKEKKKVSDVLHSLFSNVVSLGLKADNQKHFLC